ncbi:MAG: glycosyltransferase family 4 protein [Candidatus Roizmanbacteria bacterium]|nr:glycosyltransferase family 4 protein [Candidatus Roizmanbacteria bacterium]
MIKPNVALVRGAYLNPFEMQNYAPLHTNYHLTAYSSMTPIGTHETIPTVRLASIADSVSYLSSHHLQLLAKTISHIARKTIGGEHILFGLEQKLKHTHIVHTADPHYHFSFQSVKAKKLNRRLRIVSTSWDTIPFNNETIALKKLQKYTVLKHADLFICHSTRAQKALLLEGVLEHRVRHVPLGVDTKLFFPNPQSSQPHTILFVGRLVREKGVLVLIDAFEALYKKHPHAQLFILGSGPLEKTIRTHLLHKGLSHAVTITKLRYSAIVQLYHKAQIFVLPSISNATWEEQYGMALIEAMACGLPIITTDSGAIGEVVGNAAITITQNNVPELFSALDMLYTSEDIRKKIGTMGYIRAQKKFSAQKFSQSLAQIYATLLNPDSDKK